MDVIREGVRVLDLLGEATGSFQLDYQWFDWSSERYLAKGNYMPDGWQQVLEPFQSIYFGAVGWPSVPDHVSLWGLLLPIRKAFDQYANVRPVRLLSGLHSRLVGKGPEHINFVCVRENTEGEYSGVGGRVHRGTPHEVALQEIVLSEQTGVLCDETVSSLAHAISRFLCDAGLRDQYGHCANGVRIIV